MAVSSLINLIMPISVIVDGKCDYFQSITLGEKYYIYNNDYPNNYDSKTACRWIGQSTPNTQIVLSCEVIDIPSSKDCKHDRLIISTTGNPKFEDGQNYCGKGTLSVVSKKNKISVGLFSTWFSSGGRFLCTVTSIEAEYPGNQTQPPPICDCGWKQQTRIVGGVETEPHEYPLMAGVVDLSRKEVYCGASIITTKHIITAAHCMVKYEAKDVGVLVGAYNISNIASTSAVMYLTDTIRPHPLYNMTTSQNDICILRTQTLINFNANVGPVCLPFRYSTDSFLGDTVTLLGWGTTEFTGPRPDVLLDANLTVVSNGKCQQELTDSIIYRSEICTYSPDKDACQYDSGGPVLWYDKSIRRLQLVGIISYGIGCGLDYPAVNTRVTSFLAWIVSVTSDAEYCIK